MRWMMRRHTQSRERGAVTVLVAILVSVVLLGIGALVTDVGSWYVERAQLQNGADAGALATAESCARGACDLSIAQTKYAAENNNAELGTNTAVTSGFPCGSSPSASSPLPACPAGTEDGTYCPAPPNPAKNYVDVHVNTDKVVAPIIGGALSASNHGRTIIACAQATWGPASSCGACAALTISACEWLENTNNGKQFAARYPPYPPSFLDTIAARTAAGINFTTSSDPNKETSPDDPPGATIAGSETVLLTHSVATVHNPCAASHSGWDAPGMFGWLSKGACTFALTGNEYPGVSGNSPPDCSATFNTSRANQTPIYLPVYSGIDSATGNYILYGFAAFVVTGWDVQNGGGAWSSAPKIMDSVISDADGTPAKDAHYCGKVFTGNSSDICLYGYFTQALISPSDLPGGGGGTELGADAVRISG